MPLHDALCTRCGTELEFPDVAIEPEAAAQRELDSHRMMRAVDAVMECLKAEGVDVVFGYPGGANLPTYDAFVDAGIRHVLVRHEAGGGHAAEGYAKASGRVGVVFATSGPGATNIVTPLTDAMMDSVPLVAFTGQVRTDLLGTDGFQEADTFGITMPIVKHSFMIQHPTEIPRAVHEAFHIARTGRPGPVLIDMPTDLTRAEIDYQPVDDVRLPGYQPTTEGNQKQIRLAAKALANSRRPVLYVGGGVINANAAAELTELALSDRLPVTCTLMGLGAFPAPHPQWLGMLGMHGTRAANYAMDEADLIVAIGARFDDRITGKLSEFAPRAKFVHIDVDPAEISKNVPAHIPIVGDARNILPRLTAEYRAAEADPERLAGWWERIEGWRAQHPLTYEDSSDTEIKPQYMVQALYEATGGDCILASDVGQHQMWSAQYFHFNKPRRWINSGGLGTMGFGLPAAMGAAVAMPDIPTCLITGDASIQMNSQELATCTENGIPVKVFIMNNGYLGMVRQWQELFWDRRYSHVDMGSWPDFVKLADAYGATGIRLTEKKTLVEDMRKAIETPGPGRRRRPRHPRGEHVPDDRARRRRARHGRVRAVGEPGTKELLTLAELEASSGVRTGRKHTLSILVENKAGVLTRIAGLFARRGFNIDTLAVGPTDDPRLSRITLTLDGAMHPIDQVTKQLHKLVNVIKIRDLEPADTVARELALFKVTADGAARGEVMQIVEIFRGKIIDVTKRSVIIEVTGEWEKIEAFERMVRPFGLVEMARTGEIAISRGRGET